MSIKEIKDIKKLQQMLKSELELRKYTYKCCQEAGEELAKNSFAWDGKEKNLVIQAMELNERYYQLKAQLLDQEAETLKAGGIIHALKQALIEIKQLLEDALDTDKTNAEQSFDNIHKAIKLCEVLDE